VNESYVYHRPSLIAVRAKICEGPITVISSSVGLHGGGGGGGGCSGLPEDPDLWVKTWCS